MAEWSIAAVLKTVVRATGPGVRIPLSPQTLNDPATGGVFCFVEDALKASFHKRKRQNKKDLKGHLRSAGLSVMDHERSE